MSNLGTVLLVEDDIDQLEMRKLILERSGYSVRTAQTAAEALALASTCFVVVMDLRIPKLEDGLGLISSLGRSCRIVVLTGDSAGLKLDVDLRLEKPCRSSVLLEAVARLAS